MAQVKSTLGRDAVILHTRRYRRGGFAGFFGKEYVEVTAAIDSAENNVSNKTDIATKNQHAQLQDEIIKLRQMVGQLVENKNSSKSVWHELLINNGIEPDIADLIIEEISLDKQTLAGNPEIVKQLLKDKLFSHLPKVKGISLKPNFCTKVAFIGATGVGKTTTIAKLAAHFTLNEGKRLALIASDTYRIAAVEQLKTYADILNIPIEVVYTPNELNKALAKYRNTDLILIDTAGRSPHNSEQIRELANFLNADSDINKYLVISATTNYKDLLQIIDKFSVCNPQNLIITKLDESVVMGNLYNVIYYNNHLNLSYVTNGQNVPDDIELFTSDKFIDYILRDK